jgi:mono/diheme cytochrome c family protein
MHLKKMFLRASLLSVLFTGTWACTYNNEEDLFDKEPTDCNLGEVKYSVQVKSILQKNCYACHSTGSNIGGILLDNYTNVRNTATSGLLLGVVNHAPGFSPMPKGGGKLANCDIEALQTWLDNGTPNN